MKEKRMLVKILNKLERINNRYQSVHIANEKAKSFSLRSFRRQTDFCYCLEGGGGGWWLSVGEGKGL